MVSVLIHFARTNDPNPEPYRDISIPRYTTPNITRTSPKLHYRNPKNDDGCFVDSLYLSLIVFSDFGKRVLEIRTYPHKPNRIVTAEFGIGLRHRTFSGGQNCLSV